MELKPQARRRGRLDMFAVGSDQIRGPHAVASSMRHAMSGEYARRTPWPWICTVRKNSSCIEDRKKRIRESETQTQYTNDLVED
jgi:hypothetical protein